MLTPHQLLVSGIALSESLTILSVHFVNFVAKSLSSPQISGYHSQTTKHNVTCGWQNSSRKSLDHSDQPTVLSDLPKYAPIYLPPVNINLIPLMFLQSCFWGTPGYLRCHCGLEHTAPPARNYFLLLNHIWLACSVMGGEWIQLITRIISN